MKIIFGLAFLFFTACGASQKNSAGKNSSSAKTFSVSGKVMHTNPYCGGARPPDEILEKAATPYPYFGKKFYVIKGTVNTEKHEVVLDFTVDTAGEFFFKLPPGIYSIIQEFQVQPLNLSKHKGDFVKVDEECLKEAWTKPYYLLEIKNADVKNLYFIFHHKCFLPKDIPCLQYKGPMPP